jgi:myosin heavy subunit
MNIEKSFRKIYSAIDLKAIDPKKEVKKTISAVEILKKDWQTLKIIAKKVGGDFGMKVELGQPGRGSFFNHEDKSITFDPLEIREDPEQAKFIAGHEGSHRAITLSPKELGLSPEKIRELYSQLGFGYLKDVVIEDPAVNDWMAEKFPGLKPYTEKTYNERLKEENVVLSTPEVQRIATQLGYWPRFTQYGSEIIRDWHQKKFSKELDPAVKKVLEETVGLARESINIIPNPQELSLEKKEIIAAAQKRFENTTDYIWLEVKKLVEMDFHTEEQRQMLQDFQQKQKELEQKRKKMEQAQKAGDKERQEELQKEIERLEKELDPFDGLPDDVKEELQEQIDKAIRESAKQLNKEIEEKQKQIETAKQKQEELEKEIKDLGEKAKSAKGKEKEDLEKQIQEKKLEKLTQEMNQQQGEQELKDIQDVLDNIQFGQEMPYPEDKLSDKTKQELEKLFNKLPRQKREELKDRAKKQLEDFEDSINKEMGGKLNKDKPESHQERRERVVREKEVAEKREKEKREREKLEKKLEEMRREKMTEYDKAYEEVVDIINSLYLRLKNFLLPERHPKWCKGYPTGSRPDLEKVMQAEADLRYLEKIWEKKTILHKFDYRFSILVDLSSSMEGEKIEETFKGMVVLAEVLEKLGIQFEILGFSDQSKIFKGWREKLNQESREKLAKMKKWGSGGTETTGATQKAYQELLKNLGKDNFLITLTDGQPNNPESLKEELAKIIEEKKVKLVGIGLGPETEFVKDFYKAAFVLEEIRVTEEERRQGQKDFSQAFADLLEDMIRHPGKY